MRNITLKTLLTILLLMMISMTAIIGAVSIFGGLASKEGLNNCRYSSPLT
ncbi:hypothetical protein NYA30BAC_01853 [Halomonas sp. NYA30]